MRNIEKLMVGTLGTAIVAEALKNNFNYMGEISNVSILTSASMLMYDIGKSICIDYFLNKRKLKKSAEIISIYSQESIE